MHIQPIAIQAALWQAFIYLLIGLFQGGVVANRRDVGVKLLLRYHRRLVHHPDFLTVADPLCEDNSLLVHRRLYSSLTLPTIAFYRKLDFLLFWGFLSFRCGLSLCAHHFRCVTGECGCRQRGCPGQQPQKYEPRGRWNG